MNRLLHNRDQLNFQQPLHLQRVQVHLLFPEQQEFHHRHHNVCLLSGLCLYSQEQRLRQLLLCDRVHLLFPEQQEFHHRHHSVCLLSDLCLHSQEQRLRQLLLYDRVHLLFPEQQEFLRRHHNVCLLSGLYLHSQEQLLRLLLLCDRVHLLFPEQQEFLRRLHNAYLLSDLYLHNQVQPLHLLLLYDPEHLHNLQHMYHYTLCRCMLCSLFLYNQVRSSHFHMCDRVHQLYLLLLKALHYILCNKLLYRMSLHLHSQVQLCFLLFPHLLYDREHQLFPVLQELLHIRNNAHPL